MGEGSRFNTLLLLVILGLLTWFMFFKTPELPEQTRKVYTVQNFSLSKTPDFYTHIMNFVNNSCRPDQRMVDFTLLPGDTPVMIVICEGDY